MSPLQGIELQRQNGTVVKSDDVIKDKLILLYFSAHWCPPCRGFTPLLKTFYEEKGKKNGVCIIFVSSDRSESEMKSYFHESHGDYYALPFNSASKNQLKKMCNVSGIPKLCLVHKEGGVVDEDVRSKVQDSPGTVVATLTTMLNQYSK